MPRGADPPRIKKTIFISQEDVDWRTQEVIPYREATLTQKSKYALIMGLPMTHYLVRFCSKGTANRAIREAM